MPFLSNPIVHPSARRAKRFEASAVAVQVMPPTPSHRLIASASCVLRPALLLPHYQHRRNGRGNPRDPFHPERRRICSRRMRAIPVRGSCNSLNSFHESNDVHRCRVTKRCSLHDACPRRSSRFPIRNSTPKVRHHPATSRARRSSPHTLQRVRRAEAIPHSAVPSLYWQPSRCATKSPLSIRTIGLRFKRRTIATRSRLCASPNFRGPSRW
jgi:hypothetical protein